MTFFVDPIYGNDLTAIPESESHPYKSISAAANAAIAFISSNPATALVFVRPGIYSELTTQEVFPINGNDINFYFQPGVEISDSSASPMFSGENVTITGYGQLFQNFNGTIFSLSPISDYEIEVYSLQANAGSLLLNSGGNLLLTVLTNAISQGFGITLNNGTSVIYIKETLSTLDNALTIRGGQHDIWANIITTTLTNTNLTLTSSTIFFSGSNPSNTNIGCVQLPLLLVSY